MTPSGPRRVLIAGMFDMQNYGDLLFPLVARHRLAPYGIEVAPVAPTGHPSGISDAIDPIGVRQAMSGEEPADAMLIGGGYVIHNQPMNFLSEYAIEEAGDWASSALWLGVTLTAALADIPVLWNAPGAPHPLGRSQKPIAIAAMRAASYVSLRDRGAAELLDPPPDLAVSIVPDTIAGLAAMWPLRSLAPAFENFLERKGADREARYLAIHMRDRSIAGIEPSALAARIDAFAEAQGLVPLLVAVGRSHDDPRTARRIAEHLRGPFVLLDDPLSLMEITAALAHCALYVGGSLHGYVACAAYGVPGVLVARPAYRKFAGFLEHTGRLEDLARDWDGAFAMAAERREGRGPGMPSAVLAALDAHWDKVRDGVLDRAYNAAPRRDFLRAFLQAGLANKGPAWALAPFLSRAGSAFARRVSTDQPAPERL